MAEEYGDVRLDAARRLMLEFAESSGLTGGRPPRRYLWTDAHAVCNLLTLAEATGENDFRSLALVLVDQVHRVLGRHRGDDERSGWISGLDDDQGAVRPTSGGLRIGKPFPERQRGDAYDPEAEWEQDGQYYHYLTKWMHALRQVAAATGERRYLDWAVELAVVAYTRFRAPSGPPRLFWKMSIDLSYPLVPSSGLHDPLDGLVTGLTLRADGVGGQQSGPGLDETIAGLSLLCRDRQWATDDPLGIGGLLFDAARLAQLPDRRAHDDLLLTVLKASHSGLAAWLRSRPLTLPGAHRLAFRELGLSIGLHAASLLRDAGLPDTAGPLASELAAQRTVRDAIEGFWLDPAERRTATWAAHRDINSVMLATSLAPAGFLEISR